MSSKSFKAATIAAASLVFAQTASAHPSIYHVGGLAAGLGHPMTGLDHVLAMIAVGLYAAQRGGRSLWLLPATFLLSMVIGGVAGFGGRDIPGIEQGIAASVLILGLMIAAGARLPMTLVLSLISLFAMFHGYAHGVELRPGLAPASYAIGFLLATATLHAVGIGIGVLARRTMTDTFSQIVGSGIAICGMALFWM